MDIKTVTERVATALGQPVAELEQHGDRIRAQRHQGWMADECWMVAREAPLAGLIDHTVLKPEAQDSDVVNLCNEARKFGFPAVCVNPVFVAAAADSLAGSGVRVAAVVGFPLGASTSMLKALEATDCMAHGATELDMVIHVGALKAGDFKAVLSDVGAVVGVAGKRALVKVILETALLTDEEIVAACLICKWAGADYVKTSTGFSPSGASVPHVNLMRATVGEKLGVKAAGGIKDAVTARAMVQAGASRIGTSRGPQISA